MRYPGAYEPSLWRDIERLAEQLVSGFEVQTGILHIEFLVADDDRRVYLIEFAVRGCGSKVTTHLMPRLTGIDVIRTVVRQAFGLSAPIEPVRALHGALHFLMFPPGRVRAVHGVDDARSVPGVIDVVVERGPGDIIDEVRDGRSRPGHLLVSGPTRADVRNTIDKVRAMVRSTMKM